MNMAYAYTARVSVAACGIPKNEAGRTAADGGISHQALRGHEAGEMTKGQGRGRRGPPPADKPTGETGEKKCQRRR